MKRVNVLLMGLVMLATISTVAMSDGAASRTWVVPDKRITHLNVQVGEMVNLETFCIAQDGTRAPLTYDRSETPFTIPPGYSFVVTDVIAYPFCLGAPDPDARWFFVLEGRSGRRFLAQFRGDSTIHYALNGGLAFAAGNEPNVRMVVDPALSAGSLDAQVLGYFVKGDALAPEAPRF